MKKIALFNTFEEAQSKLNGYNDLAKHPTSLSGFTLTTIEQGHGGYYFNFSDCIEHGGLAAAHIEADQNNLNIIEVYDS